MWNVSADLTHGGGSVAFYYRNSVKRKQMNCTTCLAIFGLMYSKTDLTSAKGIRDLPSPELLLCLLHMQLNTTHNLKRIGTENLQVT
jgi:hypothetical protein